MSRKYNNVRHSPVPFCLMAAISDSSRYCRCLAFGSQNLVSAFNETEAHRGLLQPSTLSQIGLLEKAATGM